MRGPLRTSARPGHAIYTAPSSLPASHASSYSQFVAGTGITRLQLGEPISSADFLCCTQVSSGFWECMKNGTKQNL
jgi:hypothetical protein